MEDPDGAPWEIYAVLADAPAETGIAGDGSCCVPEAVGSVPVAVGATAGRLILLLTEPKAIGEQAR